MTAKEKAKELVRKYWDLGGIDVLEAKQCALIAVDEIIKEIDVFFLHRYDATDRYFYWKEVKQEIEKL